MKAKHIIGIITSALLLVGCAGEDAEVEEAKYEVAKGTLAGGEAAYAMVKDKVEADVAGQTIASKYRLEYFRIYAGAQALRAGFQGSKLVAAFVYRDGNDTLKNLRASFMLASDAESKLLDAITALNHLVGHEGFTSWPVTREKNGIHFQRALMYFFDSTRLLMEATDYGIEGLESGDCVTRLTAAGNLQAKVAQVDSKLDTSKAAVISSGLTTSNPAYTLINTLQDNVPATPPETTTLTAEQIQQICDYLATQ